jgi:Tol biopolymer transport system component
MKHAAWVIGLVAGVTGCSGAIVGGDSGHVGAGGNFSGVGGVPQGQAGGSGGGSAQLGQGGFDLIEPAPSCDSAVDAWIAFDSDAADFNRDLYLVRPDGTRLTRLTSDPSVEKEPYFSPSGDRLSFTSDRSGSMQIYIMELSTRSVTQVTNRPEGADQSSFSADGSLLAFHSGPSVFTIEPDGSNETVVATADKLNPYHNPRFIGNAQLVFGNEHELDLIDLGNANLSTIVRQTTSPVSTASVSPDSNEIAYATQCLVGKTSAQLEPGLSIWTAPSTGSSEFCSGRRVTPAYDTLTNTHPSWGPQSTFAYERLDSATNIGRITLNGRAPGSRPCSLTPASQDSRNPNWSPEGLEIQDPSAE